MKRDILLPAFIALTFHGIIALIPMGFLVHTSLSSPSNPPLKILLVQKIPLSPKSAPIPINKVAPIVQKQKPRKPIPPIKREIKHPDTRAVKPPVKKKLVQQNPSSNVNKIVKSGHKQKPAENRVEKLPGKSRNVSAPANPIKSAVESQVKSEQKPEVAEKSQQFIEQNTENRHARKERIENRVNSDKSLQTGSLQPSHEQTKSKPVLTMAIPKYKINEPPHYPRIARLRGQKGTCVIRVKVLPDGTVEDAVIGTSSRYSALDNAALLTVKSWRFTPGTQNGKPVAMWVQVPITFRLK